LILGAMGAASACSGTSSSPVDDATAAGDAGQDPESGGNAGADAAGPQAPADGAAQADAAIDVASVPGLVLWLDATRGVLHFSGVVASWADQSGQKNDAAQSIVYNRPTFAASAINGLPAVHFDMNAQWGTFLTIADSASLRWGTDDVYLAVVARFDNDVGGTGSNSRFGTFYFKQGASGGPFFHANAPGKTPTSGFAFELSDDAAHRVVSTGLGYDDARGHLFAVRRRGTTLELRHNGAPDGARTVPVVDVSAPGVAVSLGATMERIDSNRLNGDIAEILAVRGALSDATLAGVESYLRAKYALP